MLRPSHTARTLTPANPLLRQRQLSRTEQQQLDLRLPVSEARFDRAMDMAARHMGGTYNRNTGVIHLPREFARPGDRSFPTELQVLYRKFPCSALMTEPEDAEGNLMPSARRPCISFDVIPNTPGDPRRGRIYQSFQGDVDSSKTLFGKFLGWLKILSTAIRRYRSQVERGQAATFGRVASQLFPESSVERVARQWLLRDRRALSASDSSRV